MFGSDDAAVIFVISLLSLPSLPSPLFIVFIFALVVLAVRESFISLFLGLTMMPSGCIASAYQRKLVLDRVL